MALARSYDEFWALGLGAFLWTDTIVNGQSTPSLLIKVPNEPGSDVLEVIRIFPRRSESNWAASGQILGWDGNVEFPTLYGSLWHRKPEGWHGFLENGELRAA